MVNFVDETFQWTQPFDGQYPRPWMTDLSDPQSADCLIVGRNQRNGFEVSKVGSHDRYVDSLFNRNGETCRAMYERLSDTSPTQINIDRLAKRLKAGGARVLETNVICFSTPMSSDLTLEQRKHGTAILEWLLSRIDPKVIIVHGGGAAKDLKKLDTRRIEIIEMPALAPPAYNRWHRQSETILDQIAAKALTAVRG